LLQPIKVNRRNLAKTQCYELICGEGRCLACKKLGHAAIYAEVVDYDGVSQWHRIVTMLRLWCSRKTRSRSFADRAEVSVMEK